MASTWDRWQPRIAFSTNAFKKTTWRDAVTTIGGIGYAGCEIMADQPHFTPSQLDADAHGELAKATKKAGLTVSNVNAFTGFFAAQFPHGQPLGDTYAPTWLDADDDRVAVRVEHTLASLRLAAALGAGTVSLQPGGPTVGRPESRDEHLERFAGGVAQCVPLARELGVTLAVEPEPGLLIETTAEYREWKQRHFADEPRVSMNFDVGHAFCVDEDPAAVARELAGEYAHVHLEDIADTRVHQHLAPGEGAIDFKSLFTALDDVGYDGWVTVELYPFLDDAAGVAKRAYKHLRKLLS